jgi:hypothetical protein
LSIEEIQMPTFSVIIPVPISGFGASVDVSMLAGEKTVSLSGTYSGSYVLYATHDGLNFAPLLIFDSGGVDGIKKTFSGAFSRMRLKSLASHTSGVSMSVSGTELQNNSSFASVSSSSLDLGNDAYQTDLNFMGFGQLDGRVVVEGSPDNIGWNPIGDFESSSLGASLLGNSGIEFSPVMCSDKVRYVRTRNSPSGFLVTVGGAKSSGSGGAETLADAYASGGVQLDQTLTLENAKGGKVIFDASGSGFTDSTVLEVVVPGGVGLEVLKRGGLNLGPNNNLVIGSYGNPNPLDTGATYAISIDNAVYGSGRVGSASVAIGMNMRCHGYLAVSFGSNCETKGDRSSSFGTSSAVLNSASDSIAAGSSCSVDGGSGNLAAGFAARAMTGSINTLVMGSNVDASDANQLVMGSGASGGLSSPGAVVFGCGARAGNNVTVPDSTNAVVMGTGAVVEGIEGMAFGTQASAGIREIVFSSAAGGGSNKFEVVGSMPGNLDLFKFDVANVLLAFDTSMSLLYKDTGGNVVCNPVKVEAVTGHLYVAP